SRCWRRAPRGPVRTRPRLLRAGRRGAAAGGCGRFPAAGGSRGSRRGAPRLPASPPARARRRGRHEARRGDVRAGVPSVLAPGGADQLAEELAAGTRQAGHHRPDRYLEDAGDLAGAALLHLPEDEHFSRLGRKAGGGRAGLAGGAGLKEGELGRGPGVDDLLQLLVGLGVLESAEPALLPAEGEADVADDGEQPGPGALPRETPEVTEGPQEGVLKDVLRVRLVADQRPSKSQRGGGMGACELFEFSGFLVHLRHDSVTGCPIPCGDGIVRRPVESGVTWPTNSIDVRCCSSSDSAGWSWVPGFPGFRWSRRRGARRTSSSCSSPTRTGDSVVRPTPRRTRP